MDVSKVTKKEIRKHKVFNLNYPHAILLLVRHLLNIIYERYCPDASSSSSELIGVSFFS